MSEKGKIIELKGKLRDALEEKERLRRSYHIALEALSYKVPEGKEFYLEYVTKEGLN